MLFVTTETVPGKEIVETLGIVRGSTVRARNIGRDMFAGLKNLVGGEISEYTQLLAEAREQALKRMLMDAQKLGAHAVVNVRFNTSQVTQGAAEMLAYGTAVKTEVMFRIIFLIALIILILFGVRLLYVIVNRILEKRNEDFEKRDN